MRIELLFDLVLITCLFWIFWDLFCCCQWFKHFNNVLCFATIHKNLEMKWNGPWVFDLSFMETRCQKSHISLLSKYIQRGLWQNLYSSISKLNRITCLFNCSTELFAFKYLNLTNRFCNEFFLLAAQELILYSVQAEYFCFLLNLIEFSNFKGYPTQAMWFLAAYNKNKQ